MMKDKFFKPVLWIILSAVILILAFPKTDLWILAWIGLIPLFAALDGKRPAAGFGFGYLWGIVFFSGTLYWFIHVTVLGMVLLILYVSLYTALFGVLYSLLSKKRSMVKMFVLPSCWVVLEYVRAHLFTGFSWASLAHSQYKNLLMIQIVDMTGVLGVSFLIVMFNYVLKEYWVCKKEDRSQKRGLVLTAGLILLASGLYGIIPLRQKARGPALHVAIVQANIPQEKKWDPAAWPMIMDQYLRITGDAAQQRPGLIIWPEASFPGFVWESKERFDALRRAVARMQRPLLTGIVTKEGEDYHNSAYLLSRQGQVTQKYHKMHLVPFGEYIPLRGKFPILTDIIPIEDFTPGKDYVLFPWNDQKFSVSICFEDAVAGIIRKFVLKGSNLLINITNDAWFKDTKAPFMHLQTSVFRAIENRRDLVRVANTGVSCFVDQAGWIYNPVQNGLGVKTFIAGYSMGRPRFRDRITFYTRFGDYFVVLCLGVIAAALIRKK